MDKQTFFQTYAPLAMAAQQKYGIPASVTLAQMALESGYGKGSPAIEANNYFGIKASQKWLSEGKPYKMYIDDNNQPFKFAVFNSPQDSLEYHSRLLKGEHYSRCSQFSQTDHHNWLVGIKACGYAGDPNYVSKCENIINQYGLDKYDQMAASGQFQSQQTNVIYLTQESSGKYCLPLARTDMSVTSGYGSRRAPTSGASTNHKGLDIAAKQGENILATEDNGKIIATNHNANLASGQSVTVEYNRSDGSKYQTTYMHLSNINCQEGQTVNAGQVLGQTGSTGRSTGPHLHFQVTKISADGQSQHIDPSYYLSEISVRGNLGSNIKQGNRDLLAGYKSQMQIGQGGVQQNSLADLSNSNNPSDWLKMLSSGDAGASILNSADPLAALVGSVLGGMLSMAQMAQMQNGQTPIQDKDNKKVDSSADNENVVDRTKTNNKTVDVEKLSQTASATFDAESPERKEETNNIRLA